ncbi:putative 2OG-Fe(II) oxygenase [Salinimonas marina]|nr:putative 2OG-Fe(II) oxygenase [Salinimonas marina]
MGWLSSVCYIQLPQLNDEQQEGYLNFGQPNFQVQQNTVFAKVKPEAGKLVIFPSFFWHGTTPFSDNQPRLTVACDFTKD